MQVLTTAPLVPNATLCGAPVAKLPSRHHHEQHGIVINVIIVIIVINVISLTAIDHVPLVGKKHACGSTQPPFPPIGAPPVSSPSPR